MSQSRTSRAMVNSSFTLMNQSLSLNSQSVKAPAEKKTEKKTAVLNEVNKENTYTVTLVNNKVPMWFFSPPKKRKDRKERKQESKPQKIEAAFSWDVDKTLIDEKGNLLFPDRVRKILKRIKDNGYANYIVTARPHVKAFNDSSDRRSMNSVRERLGQDLFDGTYYTYGQDKIPALDDIVERLDLDTPSQVCHSDDDPGYYATMPDEGYVVAAVDVKDLSSDKHLDVVEAHLERMIALKNQEDDDDVPLEVRLRVKRQRR